MNKLLSNQKQSPILQIAQDPAQLQALGLAIGAGMVSAQSHLNRASRPVAFKDVTISSTSEANIYGRYSIFSCCAPGDIFGLQVQTVGLMNWLGFRSNKFYRRRVSFIPWWGPAGTKSGSSQSAGYGAPCDDPNGWDYGVCGYDLTHTSWYHRMGDGLDPHTIVQDRCETSPRYRLDGKQIKDDVEWQMNGIMNVIQQDIRHDLIHGSHSNSYQMEGLEGLIKTGYTNDDGTTCPQIDSILVDWKHDDLDGSSNGYGNFFDYLDEVVTEIEWRSQNQGTISETDMAILTSRFMATCLLDAYSCYTTCGVTTDTSDVALRAQARALRRELNGGPLYDGSNAVGYIQLKSGRRLPIIVDDAMDLEKRWGGMWCTDVYLLTRRIGSMDVLYGEYLDLSLYENRVKAQMPDFRVRVDAAGRFAFRGKEDNWCIELMLGTSPEIYLSAPWAQVRIENVCCSRVRQPMTGDPFNPTYLPGGRPLHSHRVDIG